MNVWHDLSVGDDAPEVVNAIIEIPNGSRAKYELDKETGLIKLDRVLFSAVHYPANYGLIPQTYCDDGDPLDVLIISKADFIPGCLVDAKVIGVMHMVDGGEGDDKIIAVASEDVTVNHINDLDELPEHHLQEIQNFFETYKKLEKKEVDVQGFKGKEEALKVVKESMELYKKEFSK